MDPLRFRAKPPGRPTKSPNPETRLKEGIARNAKYRTTREGRGRPLESLAVDYARKTYQLR